MSVQYTAFGEMAVTVDGDHRPLTRRRERGVLSVLLAAHSAPVAAERLVSEVWGDEPAGTLAALQVVVSRLRTLLEPGRAARTGTRLVSTAAGYSLRAEPDDVDTWRFETVADAALGADDPAACVRLADEALGLWVAEPYVDDDSPAVAHEVARLEELRLSVHEHRSRALLDLGRPEEAVRSLTELAPRHPFRERLWSQLALAQYRSSRQAEALATLRALRGRLAEELGVDPSEEVQQLEQSLLRQDPSLAATPPGPPTARQPDPGARATRISASPTSIGRQAALDQLLGVHDSVVAQGQAGFVLLVGEAGIGKSHLVRDLAAVAAATGTRTVVGRFLEGDYAPALWPWLDVVREVVGDRDPDPRLAPLLSGTATPDDSGAGTTLRMFDAVVGLLAAAAGEAPLLVVLEDVHWADASSLLLLRHLAGSPPAAPVTVLCTRRTTDAPAGDDLVDTMAALARAGAHRLRLEGLDHDAVQALLDSSVGAHAPELDAFVTDVTAGNPFFVLQYARLLAATPRLDEVDVTALPVPDGVRDVLRQRIARLPDDAARLLAVGSVLGHEVDPDVLAEVAGVPVDTALDQLDLAVASGLLEDHGSTYAFVHALTRASLYGDLTAARRMRLHDRAGRAVEHRRAAEPDAAAEIAHHAHVAAPLGGEQAERACSWLARAASVAAARQAHPEALALWRQVLRDADPATLTAAAAHRGVAAAAIRLGRMDEAHAALDAAVAIASRHGEWSMVAETTGVLSGAGPWSWREHGVVHAPFVEVLTRALPHVAPELQARLLAILQLEHFYGWRTAEVESYGRRSLELARECGEEDLLRDVLMLRLVATTGSWAAGERLALVEELLGSRPEGEPLVTLLFYLGQVRWDLGQPDAADEAMERCARAAVEVRHTGLDIPLDWWFAARARDRDDPAQEEELDAVLERHRSVGYVFSRELECLQAVRRGPVGSPVDDATVTLAEGGGMPLRAMVALALLESGRPDDARALLGEHVSDDIVDYCSTAGRAMRLLVLAETGTRSEIRQALAPLEGHLGTPVSYGTIDHLGVVDHFVAAGYAARGDDRARDGAAAAVAGNRRLGVLPWLRRSQDLLARLS